MYRSVYRYSSPKEFTVMIRTVICMVFTFFWVTAFASDPVGANEAYEQGNYEKAERLYRQAIDGDPENAKLYFNLGNTLVNLGKPDEAVQAFTRFLTLSETPEEKALGEYNIGHILSEKDQWQQAAKHFKRALYLNPSDEDAKHNFELALKKQQQNEQQQQQQNQPPPEPSAYAKEMKRQAETLVDQRRYKEAYELMQEALQTDETVAAFNNFIQRINDIITIEDN